jgi:exopolysaccharide biosynthesis polyprenyl glycosylphosphotransferase
MNPFERKLIILFVDFATCILSGFTAFYLAVALTRAEVAGIVVQLPWLYISGGIMFVVAVFNDCYSIESLGRREKFFTRWFVAWLISCSIYFIIFLLLSRESQAFRPGFVVPRLLPGIFLFILLFGIPIVRMVYEEVFGFALQASPTLLVGKHASCEHFRSEISQAGFKSWDFIAQLDPSTGLISGMEVMKETEIQLSELARFVDRMGISEIILTDPSGLSNKALTGLMNCFERGVEILSLEQAFEKTMRKIPVEHLGEGWLPTTFWAYVQVPLFYRVFKRIMDVCGSGILLIGTIPLMAAVTVLIRFTSTGPAIYRQNRVGLHGQKFVIRKFRTMNDLPKDKGQKWAEKNDPRITSVGKILRKLRIDELPQLFNVIAGQMSLVGPRPEQPDIAAELEKEIPFFRARGKVLPGITGWAQVMYRYGNSVDDSRIKLEYDLYYIKNRSILLDLIILLKTVRVVLGFKGH